MKKTFIGLAIILAAGATLAFTSVNKDKVPQAVKDAFAKKFTNILKVDWEKESVTEWEAEFKMNKIKYSANFLEDGTWQETEHEINLNEVPQNVLNSLKFTFPDFKIEETEISETPNGTIFEFEIKKGKEEIEVAIDINGKVVKKHMGDDDDKNEDDD